MYDETKIAGTVCSATIQPEGWADQVERKARVERVIQVALALATSRIASGECTETIRRSVNEAKLLIAEAEKDL